MTICKQITVAARRIDPLAFGVQKYDNNEEWNTTGGIAPNGVNATRYLRRTIPDISQLSPLAAFLVNHCPQCVAGNMPAMRSEHRVTCYNGRTEADMMRLERRKNAEGYIRCYDLENEPAKINDWRFDIIRPGQSDTEYWDTQAENIVSAGTVRVEIGNNIFEVKS